MYGSVDYILINKQWLFVVFQVSNKTLRSDIVREVAALCLLGRLDPEGLEVQGLDGPPEGQTVHLVVQVSHQSCPVTRVRG